MGLQLPAEAIEALSYLGMTWPEADEELIFERGQRWMEFADLAGEQREVACRAVDEMLANNESNGLKAFEIYWTRVGGDWGHLNGSVVTAQAIGIAHITVAAIVLAMKIAVIVQLIALAVVLVAAAAASVVSLGSSLAAAAAYARTVFFTIQRIVRAAIDAIGAYGPRLAELVGSLLEIVTKVVDSRPIHDGPDGDDGPQTAEEKQAEAEERERRKHDLSWDADRGVRDAKSEREADIALDMEEAGLVEPPVTRSEGAEGGDFTDGNGQDWDIKAFQDRNGGRGDYSDEAAQRNIQKQIDRGRGVVLDLSGLNESQRESLKQLIRDNPQWHGKVVIY
ncbi:hypothetical protein [Microlunatus sp. Y2014]|uniref:hypothetical protein n=1 Tax=Microlunatus sp. Y2014 TaxID=3418488 RepID=UPI003DA754E3